ncbi:MAG: hypothetical protein RIQ81_68 [Pseudomonadota bacterium]
MRWITITSIGVVLAGCSLAGEGKVEPKIKRGATISSTMSEEQIKQATGIVPPEGTYASKRTSATFRITGTCIQGSLEIRIADSSGTVNLTVSCSGSDGTFSADLDLSALPDGEVPLTISFLGDGSKPMFETTQKYSKLTVPPPAFQLPPQLVDGIGGIELEPVQGAVAYRLEFTPAGGGVPVAVESGSTSVAVTGLPVGVNYTVSMVAIDVAGNETESSNTATFSRTPRLSFVSTQPSSPGLDQTPVVKVKPNGAGGTVGIYSDAGCSVSLGSGVPVTAGATLTINAGSVTANSTTAIRGKYTAVNGVASACVPLVDYVHDSVAPATPVISSIAGDATSPATTSNQKPVFTGTAEAGATVSLMNGAQVLATVTTSGAGTWTWSPATNLAAGTYKIKAKAIDEAGNQSASTDEFSLTVDVILPSAPVITSVASKTTFPAYTNDTTPTISGTADSAVTVTVRDQGGVLGTTTASSGGTWSFTPTAAFSAGSYSLSATATDAAGNSSEQSPMVSMIVDLSAPQLPVFDQGGQSYSADFVVNVSASDTSAGNFVEIRYTRSNVGPLDCTTTDSSVVKAGSSPVGVSVSINAPTTNYLRAIVCDEAGNASPEESATFTNTSGGGSGTPVAPTILSIAGNSSATVDVYTDTARTNPNLQTVEISGNGAEDASTVKVYAGTDLILTVENAYDSWSGHATLPAAGHSYSITATATRGGNTSTPSPAKTMKVLGLAQPCGGRFLYVAGYLPGFSDDQQPYISRSPLPGQFYFPVHGHAFEGYTASSSLTVAAGITIMVMVETVDGTDRIAAYVGNQQNIPATREDLNWHQVDRSEVSFFENEIMKRFQVPFSGVVFNDGTNAPTTHSGNALLHTFCYPENFYPAANYTSMKATFLKPSGLNNLFNGPQECGFSNYESPSGKSFIMSAIPANEGQKPHMWFAPNLPWFGSMGGAAMGHFSSSEVSGSCQYRYDWNDPQTAYTINYAPNGMSFEFAVIPMFRGTWSAAFEQTDENNNGTGKWYLVENHSTVDDLGYPLDYDAIDWSKPVTYENSPNLLWDAEYVTWNAIQNSAFRPSGFLVSSSDLTRYRLRIEPDSYVAPQCSCDLNTTLYPYCYRAADNNIYYSAIWKIWEAGPNCP